MNARNVLTEGLSETTNPTVCTRVLPDWFLLIAVLAAGQKTGRMATGEFNFPRTSHDGSSRSNTNTRCARTGRHLYHGPMASVAHAEDVGFERATFLHNYRQSLRITGFHLRCNCISVCTVQRINNPHVGFTIG